MTSDVHHAEQHAWCYSYATCAPVAEFMPTVDAMHASIYGLHCHTAKCRDKQAWCRTEQQAGHCVGVYLEVPGVRKIEHILHIGNMEAHSGVPATFLAGHSASKDAQRSWHHSARAKTPLGTARMGSGMSTTSRVTCGMLGGGPVEASTCVCLQTTCQSQKADLGMESLYIRLQLRCEDHGNYTVGTGTMCV